MNDDRYTAGTLVDAHCHIDLMKDPVEAVSRAETVRRHTVAVTNAPSVFFHTRDLCRGKRFVYAALGLHPELVASHGHELDKFREHVSEAAFVGEIGLDYVTNDEALRKKQRKVFEKILRFSDEAGGRILSVHSRRAADDVVHAVGTGTRNSTILHWFSGTRKQSERAVAARCHFSVNAAMLSSKNGQEILSVLPQELVLTETDAPFARIAGQPSTPDNVGNATRMLASAWKMDLAETTAVVEANFMKLLTSHRLA